MPAGRLTPGERRAWRSGFIAGIEHCTGQLELFRIRFTARGVDIDAPRHWPSVTPSPAEAWAEKKFTPQLKKRRSA
jgi:hypothetical protein